MNPAQDRPGSLFVYENTVEHMSWGPPAAAQNLRRINKEKAFTPLGLKKRLHGMTDFLSASSVVRKKSVKGSLRMKS